MTHKKYLLIRWPEVQDFMEVRGFEEHSVLNISDEEGPSYFVEEDWYTKVSLVLRADRGELGKGVISLSKSNRYNNIIRLIPVNRKKHKYKLITVDCYYVRELYNGDKLIAVDPEGGPNISFGYKIDNREVTNIRKTKNGEFIITL